jgi:NAD(P)H dehydrogenase (quinone)
MSRHLSKDETVHTLEPRTLIHAHRIPETLSDEVLAKMFAPSKPADITVLEDPSVLENYDAFLLVIPTRYGNFPAQWKTFWDKNGKQWSSGGFWGKLAGVFISTASLGGGQESTALAAISTLAHHGIIYMPFGYAKAAAAEHAAARSANGVKPAASAAAKAQTRRTPRQRQPEDGDKEGDLCGLPSKCVLL